MPLWGNVDNAANSTIYAAAQVHLTPNTDNQTMLFNNVTSSGIITDQIVGQFAIDTNEQAQSRAPGAAERPGHAGWHLRTAGTGGRAGRVHYETLVAMGSITDDSSNNILPQQAIVISSQPSACTTEYTSTSNNASFTVGAYLVPSGGSITYAWTANGVTVVNGGTWGNSTVTGATLNIAKTHLIGGMIKIRGVLSKSGANTVYTSNAVLTVANSP